MQKILFICLFALLAMTAGVEAREGARPMSLAPLLQELKDEGAKISWRGRTGCCDLWVVTSPKDKVMWLSTDRKLSGVTYLTVEGDELSPEAVRKQLEMAKK